MTGEDDLQSATNRYQGLRRVIHNGASVLVAVTNEGLFPMDTTLAEALAGGVGNVHRAFDDALLAPMLTSEVTTLAPVDVQEVWASGVTYERSRVARVAESSSMAYDLVYDADRPELFYKAAAWRVPRSGAPLRIRADSGWDVPEPELGLVLSAGGELAGYLVANDMSSRAIESENPLYLPQAKLFDDSVGLSDTIVLARSWPDGTPLTIRLTIRRTEQVVFEGETSTASMRRSFHELSGYLFRELSFPHGVVLLTGTGIVPPDEFTLAHGDQVEIVIPGVGRLQHDVYCRAPATNGEVGRTR